MHQAWGTEALVSSVAQRDYRTIATCPGQHASPSQVTPQHFVRPWLKVCQYQCLKRGTVWSWSGLEPGLLNPESSTLTITAPSLTLLIFYFSLPQVWKRKESEYSFLWRTHSLENSELLRPEFSGEIRPSLITGKPEKYFPRWKRWLRYGLSFLLTLPVLLLAVGAMLCSLNFNGYIKDKESPVYIASFAYFAEPVL